MVLRGLICVLALELALASPFAPVQLDCSRVDPSYCCVMKVKYVCHIMCENIECQNPVDGGNRGFGEVQGPRGGGGGGTSGRHDGDSAPKRKTRFEESIDSETSTVFPTLITAPPIATAPFAPTPEPEFPRVKFATNPPTESTSSAVNGETATKPKKKKKSRVLKPPTAPGNEELVHIDEVDQFEIPSTDLTSDEDSQTVSVEQAVSKPVDSFAEVPSHGFVPRFSIKPSEPKAESSSSSSFPASQFSIDGSAPDPKSLNGETRPSSLGQQGIFTKRIDEVIGSLFTSAFNTSDLLSRRAKLSKTSQLLKQSNFVSRSGLSPQRVAVTSNSVAAPQCGKAPDYTPCVPVQEANRRLLQCCQKKLLPPGCHDLCRYDVTQAAIKAALDSGRCGLLSIAPYLECASEGKNNVECCRQRGVVAKSGPQCEVFCATSNGIGPLGIQHIPCGGVIEDMLHCHHAGLV